MSNRVRAIQYAGDERETTPEDFGNDITELIEAFDPDVVLMTETAPQDRANKVNRIQGYVLLREAKGTRAERECSILFKKSRFKKIAFTTLPLTKARGPLRFEDGLEAAAAILKDTETGLNWMFSDYHSPAHVEAKGGFARLRSSANQVHLYRTGAWGYRRAVSKFSKGYNVRGRRYAGADWNLNWLVRWVRVFLNRVWKKSRMKAFFPAATLGPRRIDGAFTDADAVFRTAVKKRSNHRVLVVDLFDKKHPREVA